MVRLFFDILHGIKRKNISLVHGIEFAVFLGFDGQLKQNSNMEKELFATTIKQLKKIKMSKLENALLWIYVKTWGLQGQHVVDQHGIWKFARKDLKTAIMRVAYASEESGSELIEDLTALILGRFETGGLDEFYQWSKTIHGEIIENTNDQESTSDVDSSDDDDIETKVSKNRARIIDLEKSIVAFRAIGVENQRTGRSQVNIDQGV